MRSTFVVLYILYINMAGSTDHCIGKTHYDLPLEDRSFSVKDNPDSEFLTSVNEESRESCIKKCCNTDKCNILSFNQTLVPPIVKNCFLYFCPSIESCNYQYAFNILTFTIRDEPINEEIDTTVTQPEEVITDKVVDVINDTDVDMTLLNNLLNNTDKTMLSSGISGTRTSPTATTNTLPSPVLLPTNEILTTNSTSISLPTSIPTTSAEVTKGSLSSSSSSQLNNTADKSLTTIMGATNDSSEHATSSSTMQSKPVDKSSTTASEPSIATVKLQNNTILTTQTSTILKPTITTNSENQATTEHGTVNTTNPSLNSTLNSLDNSTTTQQVIPNLNSTILQTTSAMNSSQTSTVDKVKSSSVSQSNNSLPVTKSSTDGIQTSTEIKTVNSTNSSNVFTPATSTTIKVNDTTQQNVSITTEPQKTTTEQTHTSSDNSSNTASSIAPVKSGETNITFADTNQLKEERKEYNVLSAALIAALSFGILFFFAVMVLIGKRCFDSWQRRHYSRIDYLVNGMYN